MNKRLCNKKKKRRIRKRWNDQARKEDLELPIKSTFLPDVDFTGLATRTPQDLQKRFRSLEKEAQEKSGRHRRRRTWPRSLRKKWVETLCEGESATHKKEKILSHSRILLRAQVEEGQNGKLRPHHHPCNDK